MKTEARKGKEAGCAPMRKKHKTGEARGRPSWRSSFLSDPGAKVFCRKHGNSPNQKETGKKERSDPFASCQDQCHHGGSNDE